MNQGNHRPLALSIAFTFCLLLSSTSFAQAYKIGAGWRYGSSTHGPTVKISPRPGLAIEAMVGIWPVGKSVTILVEKYKPIARNTLQFYTGAGLHTRFNYTQEDPIEFLAVRLPEMTPNRLKFGVGVDFIAGLELKIPVIPLTIFGEVKPMAEITPWGDLHVALDPAIGARLVFGKWDSRKRRRSNQGRCGKWGCG